MATMTRRMVPALALIPGAVVATTSCSGPASHQSAGSRAGTASASLVATHFQRLDYSLAVPRGWRSQEGYLDWGSGGGPPRAGAPPFDDFLAPGSAPRLLVGERAVPDAAPLDQWIGQMRTGCPGRFARSRAAVRAVGPLVQVRFMTDTADPPRIPSV